MTDFAAFRALFPALGRLTYLNNATSCPGAKPVLAAFRRGLDEWEAGRFSWQGWEAEAEASRGLFARLVGGRATEVALFSSFAEAAATVASSLPTGRVVVPATEFRSNFLPWAMLSRRGFEVVEVAAEGAAVRTRALLEATVPGTVLVAVSEVQSSNGFRVDVAEIGARCREVGARLFLDLTQTLGVLRFDAATAGADFVAAHGYKWLLGPRGATWLWSHPERLGELEPLAANWKSVPQPYADYYGGPLELAADAHKLDAPLAWLSWLAARAALELVGSLDAEAVERRCLALAAEFRHEARKRGFEPAPEEVPSQIAAVRVPDPEGVRARLEAQNVIAAVRGGWLRLGFHAYNDASDLSAALAALGRP